MTRAGRIVTVSLWAVLAASSAAAQPGAPPRRHASDPLPQGKLLIQFHHDVWQTGQGLPQNSIEAIAQTRDGYLWVGTRQGLARFDGVQFVPFDRTTHPELGHILISRLLVTDDGSLWIGTVGGGLSRLRDGRVETFTTRNGLPGDAILALCEDDAQRLWVATSGGLVRFDGRGFTRVPVQAPAGALVVTLARGARGLWAGTQRHGLLQLAEDGGTAVAREEGLPDAHVTAIAEAQGGDLWIGTPQGLARLRDGQVTTLLREQAVRTLRVDRAGTLWVGTAGGVLRFVDAKPAGTLEGDPLTDVDVLSLFDDREGNLWIGTRAGGLNRLQNRAFTLYGRREGWPRFPASTIYQDPAERIWVGTLGGGLLQFVNDKFVRYTAQQDRLGSNVITSLAALGPDLWVGTDGGGVSVLRNGTFSTPIPAAALPSPVVRVLESTRSGALWIGTDGGLARYREGQPLETIRTEDGLPSNSIQALHTDARGAVWIGTNGGGITVLDGTTMRHIRMAQGLSSDFITSFQTERDGTLWVGTYGGGLNRVREKSICHVTTKEGLFDNVIFDLIDDGQPARRLWMNSARGIFSIPLDELHATCEGRRSSVSGRLYRVTDGGRLIEGSSGQQPLGWRMRDGRLWFATLLGVLVMAPGEADPLGPAPRVLVEGVTVDGVDAPPGGSYRARWEGGAVRFTWSAPTFRAAPIRFRYQLEGFDPGWIESGTTRLASYTNLPPGGYTFRVQSDDGEGRWAAQDAVFALTLAPRFYQTVWFYVAGLVTLGGLAIVAYRVRVRHLKAREHGLTALVDERTRALQHEMTERVRAEEERRALDRRMQDAQRLESLGLLAGGIAHDFNNLLVGILGQAGLVRQDLQPDSPVRPQVEQIERAATRAAELTSQLLAYSGRGRFVLERVNLASLVTEMAKLLETAIAKHVAIRFDFAPDLPAIEADAAQIRQVVMNLLTNASDALADREGEIVVRVDTVDAGADAPPPSGLPRGRYVRLLVRDTGVGMDASTVSRIFDPFFTTKFTGRGLGLAAVQGIVRGHRGAISVASTPGAGTTFEVLFPALEEPAPKAVERRIQPPAAAARGTVLLVDDDATVRAVGRSALERAGFTVIVASDGREALDAFRARTSAIDCVLLDLTMPRQSGAETLRQIRGLDADVPVVLSSGYTEQDVTSRLAGIATQGFIQKPWTPDMLVRAIEDAVAASVRERVLR
jgi:ligand-binding sensor domain-containing protein/signal transduction histidine kinase/CheY-like chemotaxis protein